MKTFKKGKIMTFKEAFKNLTLKFTSSNDIEIERATILRTEWDAIKVEIDKLKEIEFMYDNLQK